MKRNQYILILFGFYILINACRKSSEDIRRTPLPADALRWVQLSNKNPKFKHYRADSKGIMRIDTVQGVYTLTHGNYNETHEYDVLYYERYRNVLSIDVALINDITTFQDVFVVDNYKENAYHGQINNLDPYLNQNSQLDTALINGKLYTNVFKSHSLNFNYYIPIVS
jgi:hypothetical protein